MPRRQHLFRSGRRIEKLHGIFVLCALLTCISTSKVYAAAAGLSSVKDYGAVGNGIADDTAAFQSALNAAKTAFVPAGRYRLTAQVLVPADGALVGDGTLAIEWDPPTAGNAEGGSAIRLNGNNSRIEGVRIEKKFVDGSYGTGVLANRCSNLRIHNVAISGYSARYGIHLIECTEFQITGCTISDFMMNTTADMIEDSPAGIRITRSLRGTIQDCIVKKIEVGPTGLTSISPLRPSYGQQGYQSDNMTLMQCRDVAIIGNTIQTSGEGIDLLLSESCTVSGNVIQDIYLFGMKMLGTSFCAVGENMFSDCYQAINFDDGASSTKSYGNVFHANMIRDTGSPGSFGTPGASRITYHGPWGVDLNGVSNWNSVTENVILDTQQTKTMTQGVFANSQPNNRSADNIISTALTYLSQQPFTAIRDWLLY